MTKQINDRFQILLLKSLFFNEVYTRKVLPFIKEPYFDEESEKTIFNVYNDLFLKTDSIPSIEMVSIKISELKNISESNIKKIKEVLGKMEQPQVDLDFLVSETEKWCKDSAIFNAIMSSVGIVGDTTGKKPKGAVLDVINEALSVTFGCYYLMFTFSNNSIFLGKYWCYF